MPKDEWLKAKRREIARRATFVKQTQPKKRPRKPERERAFTLEELAERLHRKPSRKRDKEETKRTTAAVQGRVRQGRHIWYLPPPYGSGKHPVPSPEELRVMFG